MPKLDTLSDTTNSTVNANNDKITAGIENTLSLDGSTPNSMSAHLDMNGFSVFNVGAVTTSSALNPYDELESAGKNEMFTGQDGGWRDMIGQAVNPTAGVTIPTWTQIGSSPFYAYAYAVNDQQWFFYHIQHDYSPGTPIYLHVHWLTSGTSAATVKWEFTWTFAKGFNQGAASTYDITGTTLANHIAVLWLEHGLTI